MTENPLGYEKISKLLKDFCHSQYYGVSCRLNLQYCGSDFYWTGCGDAGKCSYKCGVSCYNGRNCAGIAFGNWRCIKL